MKARYLTLDVFTDRPFGGNQLAVLPDAAGIPERHLLDIAREFNFSETTFVFPPADSRNTRRVRIFTPGGEIPFAGHPTVGTAHALAAIGDIALPGGEARVLFEEGVGIVPVTVRAGSDGRPAFAQLTTAIVPQPLEPPRPEPPVLAATLSLRTEDLVLGDWAPVPVTSGIPFLFVPVRSRDAVRRARVRMDLWDSWLRGSPSSEIMVFAMDAEHAGHDVRARVFVPGLNIPEDPATGSACASLGRYLADRDPRRDGTLRWTVEQGFEMGRPSLIEVEVEKEAGAVTTVRVGGASVMMGEGELNVPD
jgi:trans-2,3-dihydro-3-hydroxyanthranilate isomerase